MFSLNISLGNLSWRLLYKNKETAEAAIEDYGRAQHNYGAGITHHWIHSDDFGQTINLDLRCNPSSMLEDLDKTKLAHIELMLHAERTKVLFTKMAQSDPGLRASNMMTTPILNPVGNGVNKPF